MERYADSQNEEVSNKNPIAITGIGVKIDACFLYNGENVKLAVMV